MQQPPAAIQIAGVPAADISLVPSQEIQLGSCVIDLRYYYELQNKNFSDLVVDSSSPFSEMFNKYGFKFFLAKSSSSAAFVSVSDLENVHKAIVDFDSLMPESMRKALMDKYQTSGLDIIIVDDVSDSMFMTNESATLTPTPSTADNCMEAYRSAHGLPESSPRIILLKLSTIKLGLNNSGDATQAVNSIFEEIQHTAQSSLIDYSKLGQLYNPDARNEVAEIPAQIMGYYLDSNEGSNSVGLYDSTNKKQVQQYDNYEGGYQVNGRYIYTFVGGIERYGFGSLLGEGLLRMGVPMDSVNRIDSNFASIMNNLDVSKVTETDVMKLLAPSILQTIPQNIQPWGTPIESLNEILATSLINGWDHTPGWDWSVEYAKYKLGDNGPHGEINASKHLAGQDVTFFMEGSDIYNGGYYGEQFDPILLPLTIDVDSTYTVRTTQSVIIYQELPDGTRSKINIEPLTNYPLSFKAGTRLIIGVKNDELANPDFGDQITFTVGENLETEVETLTPIEQQPGQYALLERDMPRMLDSMLQDPNNVNFFRTANLLQGGITTSFLKLTFQGNAEADSFLNNFILDPVSGFYLDSQSGRVVLAEYLEGNSLYLVVPFGNNLNQGYSELIKLYRSKNSLQPLSIAIPENEIGGIYYGL